LIDQGSFPEPLNVHFASAGLFKATDLPFVLGRPFTEEEDRAGGPNVVVLGEHLWRSRFQADRHVIGKNLTMSGQTFQIIGVCPPQIDDLNPTKDLADLYAPVHVSAVFGYHLDRRNSHTWQCIGRLRKDVSRAQAQADLNRVYRNLVSRYPDTDEGWNLRIYSILDIVIHNYSSSIWLLGAAAGCLMLISTANVGNLLFARALERRREVAIHAALGALRRHLLVRGITETMVLALFGAALGLVVAIFSIGIIKTLSSEELYRVQSTSLDIRTLLFVGGITVGVSLLSGWLPAWSISKADPGLALDQNRSGMVGPKRQRIQAAIAVGQLAVASMLLIGTGLLVRSFQAVQAVPIGFNPHHLLTASVFPTNARYKAMPAIHRFFDEVLDKVLRLPGVTDAAVDDGMPFVGDWAAFAFPVYLQSQPGSELGQGPPMIPQAISPGYFKTIQIPLLEGRDFDEQDQAESQNVAIIDDSLAQRFFPGQSPIGKQIHDQIPFDLKNAWTIVGVVQASLQNQPDNGRTAPCQVYFPYHQRQIWGERIILRTTGDPVALIPDLRKAVASLDPGVAVTECAALDELIASKYVARRLGVVLVSVFSCAALLLSAVGIYGVLAYSVGQRRREIGVRIALGAQAWNILRLVIGQGFKLVFIGLLVGIVTALAFVRFIDSILYGVSSNDPVSLGLAVLVLGLAALLACLLPALRATRINPITALRE
jgi:putative ABC transport system permease protein